MKKILLATILVMVFYFMAPAQDVITTKEGNKIQAKILEVTQTELKYKRFSNPNGPTFSINKSDVLTVHYENGEDETFSNIPQNNVQESNTNEHIREDMRYSEYKDNYDYNKYIHQPGDPYNPGVAGVTSFLIPGLGQCIVDEWGRGTLFFLANLGLGIGSGVTYYGMTHYREPYKTNNTNYFWIITVTRLALDIWCISDAVKIAKVKNMYNQDIRSQRTSQLEYSISPCLTYTPCINNELQPIAGLSLSLSF